MQRPTDPGNRPAPDIWTREEAIEAFGVAYLHTGSWRDPIVEIIGGRPPEPFSSTVCLPTEAAAVAHVRKSARNDAEREVGRIDGYLESPSVRTRLALARSFKVLRRREVGILATESILDHRRREFRDVLRNGLAPMVKRLPDTLRMPVVLKDGCPVYVVDVRKFPTEPLTVRPDRIVRVHLVEQVTDGYDVTIRYEIGTVAGLLSFDGGNEDAQMAGSPPGVSVFLDGATAESQAKAYAAGIVAKLSGSTQETAHAVRPTAAPAPSAPETHTRPARRTPEPELETRDASVVPAEASRSLVLVPPSGDDQPVSTPKSSRKPLHALAVVRPLLLLSPPDEAIPGPVAVDPVPVEHIPPAVVAEPVTTARPAAFAVDQAPVAPRIDPAPGHAPASVTPPRARTDAIAPVAPAASAPSEAAAPDIDWFPVSGIPTAAVELPVGGEIVIEARSRQDAPKAGKLRGVLGRLVGRGKTRLPPAPPPVEPEPVAVAAMESAPAAPGIGDVPRRTIRPTLPIVNQVTPEAPQTPDVSLRVLSALEEALFQPVAETEAAPVLVAEVAPPPPPPRVEPLAPAKRMEPPKDLEPFPELRAFLASGGLVLSRPVSGGTSLAVGAVEGVTNSQAVLDPPIATAMATDEAIAAAA